MFREVIDCDKCGAKEIEEFGEFQVFVDRQTDAAGGPSEDVGPVIHLCPKCMRGIAGKVLAGQTFEENRTLLKEWGVKHPW